MITTQDELLKEVDELIPVIKKVPSRKDHGLDGTTWSVYNAVVLITLMNIHKLINNEIKPTRRGVTITDVREKVRETKERIKSNPEYFHKDIIAIYKKFSEDITNLISTPRE